MDAESIPALSSRLRQPDVYPHAGFLHPPAGIRHTGMAGRIGRHHVGFLVLLLHSDFGGTHLEVHHPRLYPAHNSGHRTRLPGQAAGGRYPDGFFHRPANQQGNHARQERARADRQCRQANQQRTGPRLHHQLELRHRRNLDTPRPQLQRRLFRRPPQPERNRHGKGQSDVRQPLQLVPAVLR